MVRDLSTEDAYERSNSSITGNCEQTIWMRFWLDLLATKEDVVLQPRRGRKH